MERMPFYRWLVPAQNIVVQRDTRFRGSGFSISLVDLHPDDAMAVRELYGKIKTIYTTWLDLNAPKPPPPADSLIEAVRAIREPGFLQLVDNLGQATRARGEPTPPLRKALHDIRGGALSALLGYAQLALASPERSERLLSVVYYARDHAKILRNAVSDLDDAVRRADQSSCPHDVGELVATWREGIFQSVDGPVTIDIKTQFTGNISSCCLEISAVDRVVYNLLNNAARFADDGRVSLATLLVSDQIVRIVVGNHLSMEQVRWTVEQTGGDFSRLFAGDITHNGQGIGLTNCLDIVAASFGISSRQDALAAGLIGATLYDQYFYSWFHWPIYTAA